MVLKASLHEYICNKYVHYLKQWMLYAADIDNIETHHELDFFGVSYLIKEKNFPK